jgi:hypothetical protein
MHWICGGAGAHANYMFGQAERICSMLLKILGCLLLELQLQRKGVG